MHLILFWKLATHSSITKIFNLQKRCLMVSCRVRRYLHCSFFVIEFLLSNMHIENAPLKFQCNQFFYIMSFHGYNFTHKHLPCTSPIKCLHETHNHFYIDLVIATRLWDIYLSQFITLAAVRGWVWPKGSRPHDAVPPLLRRRRVEGHSSPTVPHQ